MDLHACMLLVLCAVAASVPSAYAENLTATIIIPEGSHTSDCEEAGECYIPYNVTIHTGGTVTWVNEDVVYHGVGAPRYFAPPDGPAHGDIPDSGAGIAVWIGPGEAYSLEFDMKPGNYTYYYEAHPQSAKLITVVAAGGADHPGHGMDHPAGVVYAVMDRQEGILEVVFDDPVDAAVQPGRIQIRDGAMTPGVSLSEGELVDAGPGMLRFHLTGENRQQIAGYARPMVHIGPPVPSGGVTAGISPALAGFEPMGGFHTGGWDSGFREMAFSGDGTRLFVLGTYGHLIYRYDLPRPYDIINPSYADSVHVRPEGGTAVDFSFSDDGTMLFVLSYSWGAPSSVHSYALSAPYETARPGRAGSIVLGGHGDLVALSFSEAGDLMLVSDGERVMVYGLAVPHDVSTAEYVSALGAPGPFRDMAFSPGGERLFLLGRGDLSQYDLDPPYDTSSSDRSGYMDLQGNDAAGLDFSDDGSRMFVLQGGIIREYPLRGAHDIAAPGPPGAPRSGAGGGGLQQMAFSDDGTRLFVLGTYGQLVYRYDLPRPYDITGPSYADSMDVRPEGGTAVDFSFSDDGTMLFVLSFGGDAPSSVDSYALSAPYETARPGRAGSFVLGVHENLDALSFSESGDLMFISDGERVMVYGLAVPHDVSTAGHVLAPGFPEPFRDMAFSPGGERLFLLGRGVHQYDLDPPYDASSYDVSGYMDLQGNDAAGLDFSGDGSRMFVMQEGRIREHLLPGAHDIVFHASSVAFDPGIEEEEFEKLAFSGDGTQLFMLADSDSDIHRYELPQPYNTTGHSYSGSISVGARYQTVSDFAFSGDGTTLFILAYGGDVSLAVHAYALSTPYGITEPVHAGALVLESGGFPTGISFSAAGDLMFISEHDMIMTYGMSVPYDIAAAEYISTQATPDTFDYIAFSADGMRLALGWDEMLHQYELAVPYDASSLSGSRLLYLQDGPTGGLDFSADGTRMLVLREWRMQEYRLPVPFTVPGLASSSPRIVPAAYAPSSSHAVPMSYVSDVAFSDDGRKMFVAVADPDAVLCYNLSSPYDTAGSVYSEAYGLGHGGLAAGLAFSDDGTVMLVARHGMPDDRDGLVYPPPDGRHAAVHRYNLSSPYGISSPVPSGSFELRDGADATGGIALPPGGMVLFVAADDAVHRYNLSSPYGMSSPVFGGAYNFGVDLEQVRGLEFSPDGRRMLVSEHVRVHGYDLAAPYDLDRMQHVGTFHTGGQPAGGLALSGDGLFVAGDASITRYGPDGRILLPTGG